MDVAGAVSPWLLVSVHLSLRGPRVAPARACWVSVSSCTSLSAYVPALWAGEQDCQVELSDACFFMLPQPPGAEDVYYAPAQLCWPCAHAAVGILLQDCSSYTVPGVAQLKSPASLPCRVLP